jgi:hypothetical protein
MRDLLRQCDVERAVQRSVAAAGCRPTRQLPGGSLPAEQQHGGPRLEQYHGAHQRVDVEQRRQQRHHLPRGPLWRVRQEKSSRSLLSRGCSGSAGVLTRPAGCSETRHGRVLGHRQLSQGSTHSLTLASHTAKREDSPVGWTAVGGARRVRRVAVWADHYPAWLAAPPCRAPPSAATTLTPGRPLLSSAAASIG